MGFSVRFLLTSHCTKFGFSVPIKLHKKEITRLKRIIKSVKFMVCTGHKNKI